MFDVKKELSHDKHNILSKRVLATPKLPLKPSYRLITARGYFKETIRPIVATCSQWPTVCGKSICHI